MQLSEKSAKIILENHAKLNGYKFSEKADIIIKGLLKKNGCCPCKVGDIPCPCPTHQVEIEQKGHCHCNLFVKDN